MNRGAVYYVAGIVTALTFFTFKRLLYPDDAAQQLTQQAKKKKAVFFGDSITQHGLNPQINGWLCNFGDWWTRRVDVVNRGFSGYNSRWGLLIVEEVVVKENPDMVFLFFGANDAVDVKVAQHVPILQYKQYMNDIVNILRKVNLLCFA